jgi:hypothetical protein
MATIPTNQTHLAQLFVNRNGRVWSNYSLDLNAGNTFSIDNTPILSSTALGVTVVTSNLRQVGTLNSLDVSGDAIFGNFAYFNSEYNRLGLGTNEPGLALDILENNVNIAIGSPDINLATIGTVSNHNLAFVTDNQARITISNNGQVDFSDSINKSAVVNIHGTLNVTNIVSDTRVERTSSLQFYSTGNSTVYGLGLVWSGAPSGVKQLMLMSGPDRLYTTESIDIGANKEYYINAQPVLSTTSLGPGVIFSNLTTLGSLQTLEVSGNTDMLADLSVRGSASAGSIFVGTGSNALSINPNQINSAGDLTITTQMSNIIGNVNNSIIIGDDSNIRKPIRMFGPVSINTQNPDPKMDLTVPGDVSLGGQVQTHGSQAPISGVHTKGDICWNTEPTPNSYVGWICIADGTPGHWAPFGLIAG